MKRILALTLALMLMLCLCACGENADQPQETTTNPTTTQESVSANGGFAERPSEDSDEIEYVVKVTDTDGNPIPGAMVQVCKDSCVPGTTDADGIAKFTVTETGYKASFLMLPENYVYVDDSVTEWYFEDGSFELTIQLKAATN